ncbi:MAG: ribonuclease Y [Actinomycetota bacterium]
MTEALVAVAALAVGVAIGFLARKAIASSQAHSAEATARKVVLDAEVEATTMSQVALTEANQEIVSMRREAEEELRLRREELQRQEQRMSQQEERVHEKDEHLERKLLEHEERRQELNDRDKALAEVREALEAQVELQRAKLEQIASLTASEARDALADQVVDEAKRRAMSTVREIEERAREDGEQRARKIVTIAIQRVASQQTAESTVSVFTLPTDDMKGRIIGREGRNIRAFEAATGVNLIIDDTPDTVVLSSFDPVRREAARMTLEKLVGDGRIQPARIEEMHARSMEEIEEQIRRAGEEAVLEVGIPDLHAELVRLLGALQFRTSYGQNVLKHLLESAHIATSLAAEIGIDPTVAKRGAFLHDIGKAVTHEVEGSHALIGAEIARRLGEAPEVVHCIEAHHGEVEQRTVDAVLAQVADGISGGRPGARRESLETYVKRLERLEEICQAFEGVEKVFAMQAGREVRVIVQPDGVDDLAAGVMARDIAKQVEEELQYPGQIKITVVRESRSIEFAR